MGAATLSHEEETMPKLTVAHARCTYPMEGVPRYEEMVATCDKQVAAVKACPDFQTQLDVQACITNVSLRADDLRATIIAFGKAKALLASLETQIEQQGLALVRSHDVLESTVNDVCHGDAALVTKWGGTIATQKPAEPSTDAPANVRVKTTEDPGKVACRCDADERALIYLFQMGSDAANPDAWPAPAMVGGARHTVSGLTFGAKVYFRVAVVRRGTGQGAWSDIVGVTVK
jgi:hypothetical protein